MLSLQNRKNVEETADLVPKKGDEIDVKMSLEQKDVDDVKTEKEIMVDVHHADLPTSNLKAVVRPDREKTVGDKGFVNFKTKFGLIFAI